MSTISSFWWLVQSRLSVCFAFCSKNLEQLWELTNIISCHMNVNGVVRIPKRSWDTLTPHVAIKLNFLPNGGTKNIIFVSS